MKKLTVVMLFFVAISCGKAEWSKERLYKDCMTAMKKNSKTNGLLTNKQMESICDCTSDKMFKGYRSEGEANRDKQGIQKIATACALEAMSQ